MNIKDYISSGILESYVLGELSVEEKVEVERYAHEYPEIKLELKQIKNAFSQIHVQALEHANLSPLEDKKIIEEIIIKNKIKVPKSNLGLSFYISVIAATVALLSVFAISDLYNKNRKLEHELIRISGKQGPNENSSNIDEDVDYNFNEHYFILNGNFKKIDLSQSGINRHFASVFMDEKSHEVVLQIKYLPPIAENKQYQLWAVVKDNPIDLGLIPHGETEEYRRMKRVKDPEAFFISLEPLEGSVKPNLDTINMIYGAVNE